jgi:hypothetical protein
MVWMCRSQRIWCSRATVRPPRLQEAIHFSDQGVHVNPEPLLITLSLQPAALQTAQPAEWELPQAIGGET